MRHEKTRYEKRHETRFLLTTCRDDRGDVRPSSRELSVSQLMSESRVYSPRAAVAFSALSVVACIRKKATAFLRSILVRLGTIAATTRQQKTKKHNMATNTLGETQKVGNSR